MLKKGQQIQFICSFLQDRPQCGNFVQTATKTINKYNQQKMKQKNTENPSLRPSRDSKPNKIGKIHPPQNSIQKPTEIKPKRSVKLTLLDQTSINTEGKTQIWQENLDQPLKKKKKQRKTKTQKKLEITPNKVQSQKNYEPKKEDISEDQLRKQRAELAEEIYYLIYYKPKSFMKFDINRKSLFDLIMEGINKKQEGIKTQKKSSDKQNNVTIEQSNQRYKYHQKAREPFIELFVKGTEINSKIFSQQRISSGKVKDKYNKKFTFYPTYLITSQVFQILHQLQEERLILTGNQGISKTVSVSLFWHLVNYINEYRFQQKVQVSQTMKRIPKLIYWSISKQILQQKHSLTKFFIDQCPEIINKYKLADAAQFDWQVSVNNFYSKYFPEQKSFKVILVIDQINEIAQHGRIHKKKIQDIEERKQEGQAINFKNIRWQIAMFLKAKQYILFCNIEFKGILGLSSMNIQSLFFDQVSLSKDGNQKTLQIQRVKFSQNYFELQSLWEVCNYYIFQVKQRILRNFSEQQLSQWNQKQMKQWCLKQLLIKLEKEQYFFFTPLNVRQFIKDWQFNQDSKDEQLKELQKNFKDFFNYIINKSQQKYKNQLLKHFQKQDQNDQKRVKLMFSIYSYLISTQVDQKSESDLIPVSVLPFNKNQIDPLIDKRLFQLIDDYKTIKSMLPPALMKQLIKPCVQRQLKLFVQNLLQFAKLIPDRGTIGRMVEHFFILVLNQGNTNFSFKFKNQKAQLPQSKYQFDIKEEIYTFQHLQQTSKNSQKQNQQNLQINKLQEQKWRSKVKELKTKKNPNLKKQQNKEHSNLKKQKNKITRQYKPVQLLKRFKDTIKQMRLKKQKNAVLFPVAKGYQKSDLQKLFNTKQAVPNSKIIDLVLIESFQTRKDNSVSIWLINVTVSKQKIRSKIKNFIQEFLKFTDRNVTKFFDIEGQPQIQVNYIVFGPKHNLYHQDFENVLTNEFADKITFETNKKSNVFTVSKLQNSQKTLLKRVGFINLSEDFYFNVADQKIEKYLQTLNGILKMV